MEETLISKLHHQYLLKDNLFTEFIISIQKIATPKFFGATFDIHTPMSAVVELSFLNALQTFNKKLECLVNAFDLMYAEIKSYLSEKIAETNEETIPIVNNKDILPVLKAVIVKAKTPHIFCEISYICKLGKKLIKDRNKQHIVQMFAHALHTILDDENLYYKKSKRNKLFD